MFETQYIWNRERRDVKKNCTFGRGTVADLATFGQEKKVQIWQKKGADLKMSCS